MLVLFAVGTLAALFTAIIGAQLVQVTRQSDVVALRNIAERVATGRFRPVIR